MPWHINTTAQFLAGASGILLLGLIMVAIFGLITLITDGSRGRPPGGTRRRGLSHGGIGAYAIVEMNAGAAFRRRIQFVPAISVLATVGLAYLNNRLSLPFGIGGRPRSGVLK